MDLTELASHKRVAFAMSRGARRRRRRFGGGGTLAVGLLLVICSVAQIVISGQASEKQQQPSQLFLLAAQRAPISLVPRINQKRLDEEVDGFLMQAQTQNGSTATQATTPTIRTTSEQAAVTFETATTTTTTTAPASTSQENDDSRIPIDANRQQFVTHDQLTNASGTDALMSSESKVSQLEGAADQEAPSIGDGEEGETAITTTNSTDHRDQQWQRAATKVSYVIPGILSELYNYFTRPQAADTSSSSRDVLSPFNRTPVETSAPLPAAAADAEPVPAPVPDDLHKVEGKASHNKQAPDLHPPASLPPANGAHSKENQASSSVDNENNARQSGAGNGAGPSSIYFLSSGNGSASAAADDAGRRFLDQPAATETPPATTTSTATTTTTTLSQSKQVAQPVADANEHEQRQQPAATKRLANQSQASDQPLGNSSYADEQQQGSCFTKGGYCAIPLFRLLCDLTYPSEDCSPGRECCIYYAQKSPSEFPSGQTTPPQPAVDISDQQQQNQFIEQASRPQLASQVCRGTCVPVYHSSLCMKPKEIQESPGCLPNLVCCANPPTGGDVSLAAADISNHELEPSEMHMASSSDRTISHTSYPQEQPSSAAAVDGSSSLAAALVPLPPPMTAGAAAVEPHDQLEHSPAADQPMLSRQPGGPFYSLQRPTQRPPLLQATSKLSTSSTTSPTPHLASTAAGFMSQLYQMFKSTTSGGGQSSGGGNILRDNKQQPPSRQQQQQPAARQPSLVQVAPSMQPTAQASFLSHLFADPYQALYGAGSSSRPSSPAPPSMIQQHPSMMMGASNQASSFLLENPQLASSASKGIRYPSAPFLAPTDPSNVHMMSYPPANIQQQQQAAKFKQQMIAANNENNQPIESHQTPSNQELLYMQHQMYLQQQQFNKQNKFSFAPNQAQQQQQQQRFHYPIVAAANDNDNALQAAPATFLLASQKPQHQQATGYLPHQMTSPAVTKTTSHMKVAQPPHHLASHSHPHSPAPVDAGQLAVPVTSKQVNKPEQVTPHLAYHSRPADQGSRQQQQPARSQQQPPLEQKGFVGLPPSRQKDSAVELQAVKNTVRQPIETSPQLTPNHHEPQFQGSQSSSHRQQQNQASKSGGAHNRIQQPNNPIRVNNNGDDRLTAMSPAPSDVQVQFSAHHNVNPSPSQRVEHSQQHQQQQAWRPPPNTISTQLHQQKKRPINQIVAVHSESNASADLEEQPVAASSSSPPANRCPGSCFAHSVAVQRCVRPNYLDKSLECPMAASICCVRPPSDISQSGDRIPSVEPEITPQHQSTPPPTTTTNTGGAFFDSNKLYFPTPTIDTGDDPIIQTDNSQIDLGKFSTEATSSGDDDDSNISATTSLANSQPTKSKFQTCGVPNSSAGAGGGRRSSGQARGRVMGGSDAKPGYWCWQAALMNNKNEYLCGGALIGAKWVLTAAHCITQHLRNESQLFVQLGQHNLNSSTSAKGARSIQVKTSYVHHNHNGVTLDNDVALLRLVDSVDLDADNADEDGGSSNICLICLPERSSHRMEPGKRCIVTGYGFEDELGPAALRVRQTELPIVTDQDCQNKTSAVLGKPFQLPANSFCAGGEQGQDACHGDGGSPLSCLVDGFYELTGIVSWGYKCGSKDLPGLYSKVSTFVGWINQIVSVNN